MTYQFDGMEIGRIAISPRQFPLVYRKCVGMRYHVSVSIIRRDERYWGHGHIKYHRGFLRFPSRNPRTRRSPQPMEPRLTERGGWPR